MCLVLLGVGVRECLRPSGSVLTSSSSSPSPAALDLARHVDPALSLVVAANRDERWDRATAPATFWSDAPHVLAGLDKEKRGTWMGLTRTGRFAALTNVRDPSARRDAPRSRGQIVRDYLVGDSAPDAFSRTLVRDELPAFNFVCGTIDALTFVRDDRIEPAPITPGIHGLSNARLDDAWPKVERGKRLLSQWMERGNDDTQELFTMLDDRSIAPDESLPKTGVPLEWERALSASHIVMPLYGTRCSTVVVVRGDRATFEERTFDESGAITGIVREDFILRAS